MRNSPGLFITFEGGEGSGKGTHTNLLEEYLRSKYVVVVARDPGTTKIGEEIRKSLQDLEKPELNPITELLLYEAARAEYTTQLVLPALQQGKIFISDRFYDSTTAYQGALGIPNHLIKIFNEIASFEIIPDLTFLIDIDAKLGLKKLKGHEFGENLDKIESRKLEYHERVNQIYRDTAKQHPRRFRVIPYKNGEIDEMQEEMKIEVDNFISEKGLEAFLLKPS